MRTALPRLCGLSYYVIGPRGEAGAVVAGSSAAVSKSWLLSRRWGWLCLLWKAEGGFGLVCNNLHLSILGPLVPWQRVLRSPDQEAPLFALSVKCYLCGV